ncbi:MAG: hypothetical protein BGO67_07625 [Alphaproteobacteria bacterium 41-28]|nr:MAG: hypothetical protein BGO67_07625 [Alphaproteobacteria bacterium 41-28]
MKSKHLILLSILLSQAAPVWAMDDDGSQNSTVTARQNLPVRGPAAVALLRDAINHMEASVDQTLTTARNQAPRFYDKKVFVVGETGHGKTTFLHAVAGIPFDVIPSRNGRGFYLDVPLQKRLAGTNIGHTRTVGTVAPATVIDQGRQAVFIDCLGFGDPRGPIEDVANALGVKKLFEQGTQAKVLLVIEEETLATVRGNFVPDLLNRLAETFPDDNMLRDSVRLVITKATQGYSPQVDLGDWRNHAQTGNRAKILIDSFLQRDRIFKFLAPISQGRYDGFNNNDFARVLGVDGYTLNPRVMPVLNPAAKLLIGDTVDELRKEGRRYLEEDASDHIQTICESKINDRTNPNRAIGALRTDLRALRSDILALTTMDDFKDPLHQIIGDNDVSGQRQMGQPQLMGGLAQSVEFLQELDPTVHTPEDSWRSALAPIAGSIEVLADDPVVTENQGILSLQGRLLSIEDLVIGKQRYPHSTLAKMFASNTTFANTPIRYENMSIAIFSPKLNSLKPTSIDLSGGVGTHKTYPQQAGQNGGHGTPGAHFLANIAAEDGLTNLTVLAKGGNGGDGARGTDGAHGADGNLDHAAHHQISTGLLPYGWGCHHGGGHSAEGHHIRSDDLRHQLDLRYTQVLYHAQGSAGSAGTDGGHGGQGAPGGTAKIAGVAWNPVPANLANGSSGSHGAGGNPGSNGRNCAGEEHIGRHLAYQALVGKSGFLGTGPGIYADRHIDLSNKTITAKSHVGNRVATAGGSKPTAPHGKVPAAISAIDENALEAEYRLFRTAELADPDAKRFVRDH